jgi:hypothetical protein
MIFCLGLNDTTSFTTLEAENDIMCTAYLSPSELQSEYNSKITWDVVDNPDDTINSGDPTDPDDGETVTFEITAPADTDGRGAPLSYLIKASVTIYGIGVSDTEIITQDSRDELRQQYIDMSYDHFSMPTRDELSLTGPAEFIDATSPAYWNADIESTVSSIENSYGYSFTIVSSGGSGFRCPIHNEEVSTATLKKNSHHAYGRAADCHFRDENGNGSTTDEWENILKILKKMTGIWYYVGREEGGSTRTGWFHVQIEY